MNKNTVNIGKIENNPNYQFNSLPNSFDHNLWRQPSALIKILFLSLFWVERFREARQAFSTLSILNKDTYFLTHTSALRGIRLFVTARKLSPQITTSKSVSYERLLSFFCVQLFFFSYKHIWVKYVIFRKNNKGLTMSSIRNMISTKSIRRKREWIALREWTWIMIMTVSTNFGQRVSEAKL